MTSSVAPDWPEIPPSPPGEPPIAAIPNPDVPPLGWPDDYGMAINGAPFDPDWPVPATDFELHHHGSNFNPDVILDTSTTRSSGPPKNWRRDDWPDLSKGGGGRLLTVPSGMNIPTLPDVQSYSVDHLTDHANHWTELAQRRRDVMGSVKNSADNLAWAGQGNDAMVAAVSGHYTTAIGEASELEAAAQTAKSGASVLSGQQKAILNAVNEAQQQGFQVGPAWTVTDAQYPPGSLPWAARQTAGQAISANLAQQVATFTAQEHATAAALSQHSVALGGESARGHIRPAGHGFKMEPGNEEPARPGPSKPPSSHGAHGGGGGIGGGAPSMGGAPAGGAPQAGVSPNPGLNSLLVPKSPGQTAPVPGMPERIRDMINNLPQNDPVYGPLRDRVQALERQSCSWNDFRSKVINVISTSAGEALAVGSVPESGPIGAMAAIAGLVPLYNTGDQLTQCLQRGLG